ncbi:MAG: glycosyltransferase family 39 protein [candidate division FCPU426 bacterium]
MKNSSGRSSSDFGWWLTLWILGLVALLAFRAWLNQTLSEPIMSSGTIFLLALLLVAGLLVLDPPSLTKRERTWLGLAACGLLLLLAGQQWLWLQSGDRDLRITAGFGLMGLGGVLVILALRKISPQGGAATRPLDRGSELWIFAGIMLLAAFARAWGLGKTPSTWWFDELNLARAIQDHVMAGETPVYVGEFVENPGAYLMVGGLLFKGFGVSIAALRALSAFFGWLALFPFYFLARRLLGARWGLVALAVFCCMRWTLIPERIAFMSGFALFLTLSAFYFSWIALGSRRPRDLALAGFSLGATLHAYTPARFATVLMLVLAALQWRQWKKRSSWKGAAVFVAAFLMAAGPILYYAFSHWDLYALRAGQVSISHDIRARGYQELWTSLGRHLAMFNFRGDGQARHNIPGWPQLDFASALILFPALIWLHVRAWRDSRAGFLALWFWVMLAQGIFTMTVEAPQAHRCILVAPAVALILAWFMAQIPWHKPSPSRSQRWTGKLLLGLGLALAAWVPFENLSEYFGVWRSSPMTWRSFSPEATLAARRAAQAAPGTQIFLGALDKEHPYYGMERRTFVRFLLKQQGRSYRMLRDSNPVDKGTGVLLIWGESEPEIGERLAREFPGTAVERVSDPFDAKADYLAAEIPIDKVPRDAAGRALFFRP